MLLTTRTRAAPPSALLGPFSLGVSLGDAKRKAGLRTELSRRAPGRRTVNEYYVIRDLT